MGSFENDLKDMFDGVEYQPSEQVWAGVERALQQKKKGIFFMWQTYGVAAGLALLAAVGFLYQSGFFNQQTNPSINKQLTELSKERNTVVDSLKTEEQIIYEQAIDSAQKVDLTNSQLTLMAQSNQTVKSDQLKEVPKTISVNASNQSLLDKGKKEDILRFEDEILDFELARPKAYQYSLAANQAAWLLRLGVDPRDLKSVNPEFTAQTDTPRELSINGRLGNNSLNMTSNADMLNAEGIQDAQFNALSDLNNREERALGAISLGTGVSMLISDRLILNASLRYTEFKSASTSNGYSIENGKSLPIYVPLGYDPDNVYFTGNYNLTNTLQGISIQPTLSYQVAKFGKFDLLLTGGFAVDYLFAYQVKGDLNFLSARKVDLSETSNFNEFNLSSVTGMGLNYRISQNFALGLDLNYRYFMPLSQASGRNKTSVIGFGLGLNYFLNRIED